MFRTLGDVVRARRMFTLRVFHTSGAMLHSASATGTFYSCYFLGANWVVKAHLIWAVRHLRHVGQDRKAPVGRRPRLLEPRNCARAGEDEDWEAKPAE
eukprot:1585253-Pyramimonas_sp.AAC.1